MLLHVDLETGGARAIKIDWGQTASHFSETDLNASLEGLCVGAESIYVANERSDGRVIEIDLQSPRQSEWPEIRLKSESDVTRTWRSSRCRSG